MKKSAINLLQEQQKEPSLWEKIYLFVTNTTRVVVIITEVLVLGAFGWRFYLDRRVNDLNEEIDTFQEVLDRVEEDELEYRILQEKFVAYNEIWENASLTHSFIPQIQSLIPDSIENESLSYSNGDLSISGSGSVEDIEAMENSINSSSLLINKFTTNYESVEDDGTNSSVREFTFVMNVIPAQERGDLIVE